MLDEVKQSLRSFESTEVKESFRLIVKAECKCILADKGTYIANTIQTTTTVDDLSLGATKVTPPAGVLNAARRAQSTCGLLSPCCSQQRC